MKLLLDTHTFLWFIGGNSKLSIVARELIEDRNNESFLSIVSLWEMAIKISIGKLSIDGEFEEFIPEQMELNGIQTLPINFPHLAQVANLPFHHRDPFDRLLIVQAKIEKMRLITRDRAFASYDIATSW